MGICLLGVCLLGVALVGGGGCVDPPPPPPPSLEAALVPPVEMPASAPVAAIVAANLQRAGSALVLATVEGRLVAFVGDRDGRVVRVVDPRTHRVMTDVATGGQPWSLTVASGRLWVALRDTNEVIAIRAHEGGQFAVSARRHLASAEPVGLAATPDGAELLVTTGWGQRLIALALPSLSEVFSVALDREPRGVAVTPDGAAAFITHAIGGQLTRIDLTAAQPRPEPLAYRGADASLPIRRRPRPTSCFGFHDDLDFDGLAFSPAIATERRPAVVSRGNMGVPRDGTQGFALVITERSVIAPTALVHTRSGDSEGGGGVYGSGGGDSGAFPGAEPALVMVPWGTTSDPVRVRVMARSFDAKRSRVGFSGVRPAESCLLPRGRRTNRSRGPSSWAVSEPTRSSRTGRRMPDSPSPRRDGGGWGRAP